MNACSLKWNKCYKNILKREIAQPTNETHTQSLALVDQSYGTYVNSNPWRVQAAFRELRVFDSDITIDNTVYYHSCNSARGGGISPSR
jgi:hypothetical protein